MENFALFIGLILLRNTPKVTTAATSKIAAMLQG